MRKIGLHKVMWGSDYPHHEGVSPYTREHLRRSFHDWSTEDLDQVLTTTACRGVRLRRRRPHPPGARGGPTAAEIAVPLDRIPEGATSPAFYM